MDDPVLFFSDESIALLKVKELVKNPKKSIDWEEMQCSSYSPAVVSNEESIARQVFSPIHYDFESKKLKPFALDDVFNKGLSTNRLRFINESKLKKIGELKAVKDRELKPEREYLGYIVASVNNVRSIVEDRDRLFSVYDSSLENQIDHADICCLKDGKSIELPKKAAKSYRRQLLINLFSELIPAE